MIVESAIRSPIHPESIAAVFSPSVFRALGQPRRSLTLKRLTPLIALFGGSSERSLAECFDMGLDVLNREYRNEYFYKNLIINRIIFGRHSPRTSSALLELGAGACIADVVVLNGTSSVYEIKTDMDNFSRLSEQLFSYQRCFERVHVVTSIERAEVAQQQTPSSVGIIGVNRRGNMTLLRDATDGLDRIDLAHLFGLLRRDEVLHILARVMCYTVDIPKSRLWARIRELFLALPIEVAHREAIAELRLRGENGTGIASSVPKSLRALAYSSPVSKPAEARILGCLDRPAVDLL